mmetsp:Transcript_144775/g.252387  ORF Transcript_144775/g.252387 Transcript_144775/m.252387 type:complete len:181 (+) Transcript_144775:1240-1782(+)
MSPRTCWKTWHRGVQVGVKVFQAAGPPPTLGFWVYGSLPLCCVFVLPLEGQGGGGVQLRGPPPHVGLIYPWLVASNLLPPSAHTIHSFLPNIVVITACFGLRILKGPSEWSQHFSQGVSWLLPLGPDKKKTLLMAAGGHLRSTKACKAQRPARYLRWASMGSATATRVVIDGSRKGTGAR